MEFGADIEGKEGTPTVVGALLRSNIGPSISRHGLHRVISGVGREPGSW